MPSYTFVEFPKKTLTPNTTLARGVTHFKMHSSKGILKIALYRGTEFLKQVELPSKDLTIALYNRKNGQTKPISPYPTDLPEVFFSSVKYEYLTLLMSNKDYIYIMSLLKDKD